MLEANGPGDGQAKAAASRIARPRTFGTPETVEYLFEVLRAETGATVRDAQFHAPCAGSADNQQLSAHRRIAQRIIDENIHHLTDPVTVGVDGQFPRNIDRHDDTGLIERCGKPAQPFDHQFLKGKLRLVQGQLTRAGEREQVQITHQFVQLAELAVDHFQLCQVTREHLVDHALYAPHGGIQRRTQLVGNHGAGFADFQFVTAELGGHGVEVADQCL